MFEIKKFIAVLTLVATAGTLVACGEENTAGGNAVAIGGTFEFVSPGGQTSISYPPEAVSYTHLTLPTTLHECRSRWSPYH